MTAVQANSTSSVHVTCDIEKGIVNGTADIAASPERIFRALTTSEQAEWWGQDGLYRTSDYSIDLRPGGAWSCKAVSPDGTTMQVGGKYITIDPPRLLEYTWEPSWDNFQTSIVRFEIEPTATGSRLTILHNGFGGREAMAKPHAEGWERVLGWLEAYVTR
jgi:uncharacterized protein YndB with AHSA1/START domain